jgi:hypothetical protein
MRFQEILEAASRLPGKYMVDDSTDLALNLPNQWSQSPYLGAVKSPNGGYMAQIHVPQDVWVAMVEQNPHKWSKAPRSFFNPTPNQRPSMIVQGFKDPRQAAWFAQEVLYGGDHKTLDIVEDYFDQRYNEGSGELWKSIRSQTPSFDGEALTAADEQTFFANRDEHKKAQTVQKNTADYDKTMKTKIRDTLVAFYTKNKALAKKRLGNIKSINQLGQAVDQAIERLGVNHFVTAPGSVKLKDVASLAL